MKIYVDKNALQDYTAKLIAKEKTIFATKDEVGSPLVASTVAEMTDHDKVYVYVGSETGYTSGNWYYWDGSAWTSGGVYNSEGFVLDDTLTSSTLPAQAKAAGDKINYAQNAIETISNVDESFVDLSAVDMTIGSYMKDTGEIASNSLMMLSDYVVIPANARRLVLNRIVYSANGSSTYPQSKVVFFFDSEQTFLGVGTISNGLYLSSVVPPNNAVYFRANFSVSTILPFVYIQRLPVVSAGKALQNLGIDSLDDLPANVISTRSSTSKNIDNIPYDGWLGTVFCYSYSDGSAASKTQLAFSSTNRLHIRRTWGSNNTWGTWAEFVSVENANNRFGFVGEYIGAFTATQIVDTGIVMKADAQYVIRFYANRTDIINIYGKGNTNNLKRFMVWDNQVIFTNDSSARNLMLYNPNGQLDDINIRVYALESIALKAEYVPQTYIVTPNADNGTYSSFSKCLYDLRNNKNPKIIEIREGDYDIYAEYQELYDAGLLEIYNGNDPSMDYFDYCIWVPENTHIIGKGIVRLMWEPDPNEDEITPNQCKCISPLNVAATCIIENVEVYCKNGRYCLHNDGLGQAQFTGAVQKFINCRFYKYGNDTDPVSGLTYGFLPTTGFGIDRDMHHVYENCTFINYANDRAFYGHSRHSAVGNNENRSSDITLVNCVIDTQGTPAVKFGNVQTNRNIHIRTMFNGCYISGLICSQLESSASSDCANAFDVQFLNCGNVSMKINDPDNPYTPKAYNTNLTIV